MTLTTQVSVPQCEAIVTWNFKAREDEGLGWLYRDVWGGDLEDTNSMLDSLICGGFAIYADKS